MIKNPFLVYQAKAFYNAYLALEKTKFDDSFLLMVPRLVNGALSAELILKAVLTEQNISYGKEHNLKILFDKLPMDIQSMIWEYLVMKAPEYADAEKRDTELLLISNAFVQWRYCYEGNIAPAFDGGFLSAFANAAIIVMFELGYNTFFEERAVPPDEHAEIDTKFENNRSESIKHNQEMIQKRKGRGKK